MRKWKEYVTDEPAKALILPFPVSSHQILIVATDTHLDDCGADVQVCRCDGRLFRLTIWARESTCDHIIDELSDIVFVNCEFHDIEGLVLDAPVFRVEEDHDSRPLFCFQQVLLGIICNAILVGLVRLVEHHHQ